MDHCKACGTGSLVSYLIRGGIGTGKLQSFCMASGFIAINTHRDSGGCTFLYKENHRLVVVMVRRYWGTKILTGKGTDSRE